MPKRDTLMAKEGKTDGKRKGGEREFREVSEEGQS